NFNAVSINSFLSICYTAYSSGSGSGGSGSVTLTVAVSVWSPSSVATIIVAVPSATAVTKPLELTVATASSVDVNVTLLFVALDGSIVAFNCLVEPVSRLLVFGDTVTPVTLIGFV